MSMVNQLPGFSPRGGKTEAIDYIVQPSLQQNQQIGTGYAFLSISLLEIITELFFHHSINFTGFLFFS
jgi:hypothetical protein